MNETNGIIRLPHLKFTRRVNFTRISPQPSNFPLIIRQYQTVLLPEPQLFYSIGNQGHWESEVTLRICPSKGLTAKPQDLRLTLLLRVNYLRLLDPPIPWPSLAGGVSTCLPPRRARLLINTCCAVKIKLFREMGEEHKQNQPSLLDYVWDPSGCLEKARKSQFSFPSKPHGNQIFQREAALIPHFLPPQQSLQATLPLGLYLSSWAAHTTAQHQAEGQQRSLPLILHVPFAALSQAGSTSGGTNSTWDVQLLEKFRLPGA